MAPEVIRTEDYNKSCDVYSFGITLWEMFTRKRPFKKCNGYQVILAVANDYIIPPLHYYYIPHQLKDLIERLEISYNKYLFLIIFKVPFYSRMSLIAKRLI
jgi:serine/threonine protein kinase